MEEVPGPGPRRFKIRDTLSVPVPSSSGFPEGDPLSPVAMLIANGIFHVYMRSFCPFVRALSYADNYTGLGVSGFDAVKGLLTAQACCDLDLDREKTYAWATDPGQRQLLKASNLTVHEHTKELGGMLSFCRGKRNKAMVARCKGMQGMWQKLERARCPQVFKLRALSGKFWAHALHGSVGCDVPESILSGMRASAVKALDVRSSGQSSMLRLTLSGHVEADPGFFSVWSTLRDFRRILHLQPGFLNGWRRFCLGFDGTLFQGPFSRMFACCSQLMWTILEPPILP